MSPRGRSWMLLAAFLAVMAAPPWVMTGLMVAAAAATAIRIARPLLRALWTPATAHDTIALATDRARRTVLVTEPELAAHGLILGASGAGKTTTLMRILSEQVVAGKPVIAIDMKGSPAFAGLLSRTCAAAGRPFKLWTMDGGARWNPLQHGNATELKDKLVGTERFTEPHYQRAAERYLQMVLKVLEIADSGRPRTLQEVVALMDPRRLPIVLRQLPAESSAGIQDYLSGLTHDQLSAIRGMQTRLALITESQAGPYLLPTADLAQTIDVRHALQGPEVVLFSLNSGTYGKLASQIGTLVVQDLVSALGRRLSLESAEPAPAATIAIDEFSGLGGDHMISLLARVREARGGVLLATQEMADLERAAAGLRDQVVGNTAFKIVHRQDVPASARLVAQMAGTEQVWEETQQFGVGIAPRRATRRQAERFILDPNEIMSLRTGEAAMISKLAGGRPRIVRVTPPEERRAPQPWSRPPTRGASGRGRPYAPPGVTR